MSPKARYLFVDQMRGLIIALMGLDHASDYFNAVWKRVSYDNYLFDSFGQFIIRYLSYLCAPGFLMLAGAMAWLSFEKRIARGAPVGEVRTSLIQRGLFLILMQLIWVNASWGGFARFRLDHFSIIGAIGSALILLALIARLKWQLRLGIALVIIMAHPLLLTIPYDPAEKNLLFRVMQLLVDAGKWNLYPVLPWFALAAIGSVAGEMWFKHWTTEKTRIRNSLVIAIAFLALFCFTRAQGGYGNISPFEHFGSISFFFVQKYPTSLPHNFLFPGLIFLLSTLFMVIGSRVRPLLHPLEVYGHTPFFFYMVHIPLLAILTRRLGVLPYREGEVGAALIGWVGLLIVMYPLCRWFAGVKARSNNRLIKMM